MRCRVCRDRADIEVRRHNAAFCREHFIEHIHRQVERTIHDFDMIQPGERLLIGVSGGKDSLALWHILTLLGHQVDGVYLDLGISDYSDESLTLTQAFASERGLTLEVVAMEETYGFTIPEAAARTHRTACSACGLSKRYALNEAAIRGGYDTLVMGHNLDDEAATLMSNVLNWNVGYLGRQRPVLPAKPGFVKKIKPLLRVAERETAAYAVLQGIDYEVAECPLVAGNSLNRLKEWMVELEHRSPGALSQFVGGFVREGSAAFEAESQVDLQACERCGRPTTGQVCAFCRLQVRATEAG